MAKAPKKGGVRSRKCKTAKAKSPYSQSWMVGFLCSALKSADVVSACRICQIEIGEYLRGRRVDPAFELACMELDLVVRAAAVATLEAAAARGEANVGKLKLLLIGIEQLRTFAGDGPEDPRGSTLPPDSPAWLLDLVTRICGKGRNLVVVHAVESSYRAAVEWSEANPDEYFGAFPFPGPCLDCTLGLSLDCPNPKCSLQMIVRNSSDLPFPGGERWREYVVVEGTPVEAVECCAANVRFELARESWDDTPESEVV